MKRLFIAIKPEFNQQTINEFKIIKNFLKNNNIKWVNFSQIHLTLKFLGNTENSLIPLIQDSLKGISSQFSAPLHLNFKGIGVFKNLKFPRVLWIGIEPNDTLTNLYKNVENEMSILGFKREKRDFNPHLTLGRIKHIKESKRFVKLITENALKEFAHVKVENFCLIESILTPSGPIYKIIETFKFI